MLEKAVFLLLLLVASCHGLYFHIGETERKCFIEEIPDETTGILKSEITEKESFSKKKKHSIYLFAVIVNYKVELYDPRSGGFMPSSPGIGMHVEVKDPDDKMVLSRVYSAEGKL